MAEEISRADRFSRTHRVLAALVAFYLIVVCLQASFKLLWVDELFTYYIAQQQGFSGVWEALRAGADPNPPLIHLCVKASTQIFGSGPLAIRLPAVLSVLVAILAMWWVLRRWLRVEFAAAGVLGFMATRGFDYSYDARSYAPLMGFAMLSLALWVATERARGWVRVAVLTGLGLSLAAGISSNYYGVLAFFPIAAGEMVRLRQGRQRQARNLRLGVWAAMLVGALPLLVYLPLIRHNIAEFAPHAWNRPHLSMVGWSYLELVEGIFWPVLGMALFTLWKRRQAWQIPLPETIAGAVLLLYPILGFAVAAGGAGMISPRCVVPVCCGFGLAVGVLAQHLFGGMRHAGRVVVALLIVWVLVREGVCFAQLQQQRTAFLEIRDRIQDLPTSEAILVGDSSLSLPLAFYSNSSTKARLTFPVDFVAIHRFANDDSGEQNLWAGRYGIFPLPITPMTAVPTDQPYLVLTPPCSWLTHDLEQQGFHFKELSGESAWERTGGVFTPMAHAETRFLQATPKE